METIKNEIINQILNYQAKQYIQKHIFENVLTSNATNRFIGSSFDSYHNVNPSSMFSSSLPNFNQHSQKMSIKHLLNRIQKLIVINGLYKTVEEIEDLKNKTLKLQKHNQDIQIKLNSQKINKSRRKSTQNGQSSQKNLKETSTNSKIFKPQKISSILSFKDKIQDVRQKLEYEKTKQNMICLVKLSSGQKLRLLQKTRKQYKNLKNHIDRLEKVIENTEKGHPEQSWLRFQVEQLEREVEQTNIMLQNDNRLQLEIEKLQRKVDLLEQKKLKHLKATKKSQHIQNQNEWKQKIFESQRRIQQLQVYIKQENSQKELLVNDIKEFNEDFERQKAKNKRLLKRIKDNFYSCPQIIDFLIKEKQNPLSNVDFVLKELQIQF